MIPAKDFPAKDSSEGFQRRARSWRRPAPCVHGWTYDTKSLPVACDHQDASPHTDVRWRPYRVECTGSLPTSEVKRRRARLVLGWGTAREDLRVLSAFEVFTAKGRLSALTPTSRQGQALGFAKLCLAGS